MFWELKGLYPGDSEFTLESYSSLPYEYVVDAYTNGIKNRRGYLHQIEAPTALLCSLFSNSKRDPKKQKTPYRLDDFFLYQPQDAQDIPTGIYGAAAMKLIESRQFPNWALTFYADLKKGAAGEAPQVLAYQHKNAIILAPVVDGHTIKGMLIADYVVSEDIIEMQSNQGEMIRLQMPKLTSQYSAQEDVTLQIQG